MVKKSNHAEIKDKSIDKKYLITFLLDHVSPDVFFKLIDEGNAPHLSKYILGEKLKDKDAYSNATICKNVVTGFPSTSANMHTSILTGTMGGRNNLFLASYWNFLGKHPKFVKTDDIGLTTVKKFNEFYVNRQTKMIFEFFPTSSSYHVCNRGAKWKAFTIKSIILNYLPLLIGLQKKDEPGRVSPIARPELWKKLFVKNMGKFLKKVKKKYLPEVNYIVFLLTDENAHRFGFDSPQYKEAIQIIDLYVKGLVEGINLKNGKHIEGLKELGYLDCIVWNIHTDHAGRPIERDKYIPINRYLETEFGLKLLEGYKDKKAKLKIKDEIKNSNNLQKINAFSIVSSEIWVGWFRNTNLINKNIKKTKNENPFAFAKFYGENLFRNIIPLNEEIAERKPKLDLIDALIKKPFIQFVIIPEENIDEISIDKLKMKDRIFRSIPRKYSIKIFSREGSAQIDRYLKDESSKIEENSIKSFDKTSTNPSAPIDSVLYSYKILNGKDPLKYNEVDIEYGKKYTPYEILQMTYQHELPDVFHRLFGFFDAIYAPNFLITSEFSYHFFSIYGNLNKILLKAQNHDGLYKIESIVPLTFAGKGVKKGIQISFARNVDVLPTILKVMNIEIQDNENYFDGKIISDVIAFKEEVKR
ncbi:MAG: alkaline phosphatase family protein [Promethearchaeota archaeon]